MSLATEITTCLEIMTRPPPAEGRGEAGARLLALIEDVRQNPGAHPAETVQKIVAMRHAMISENPGELATGRKYFAGLAAEEAAAAQAAALAQEATKDD